MPVEVKAYKCAYCPRCFGRKVNAAQHESHCIANPSSHHCKTCVHSCIINVHHHEDGGYDNISEFTYAPDDYDSNEPCCDIYDKPIYEKPYETGSDEDYDETGIFASVPFSCKNYEYKGYCGYGKRGI
ncbi:MAG TPA: hypothetical protein PKL77_06115 [Candidatus Omnitrophota bacterium]|nr:hypothetical protein [Candidatus Omnitrophota bacterium]